MVVCYVLDHAEAVKWVFTVIKLGGTSVRMFACLL